MPHGWRTFSEPNRRRGQRCSALASQATTTPNPQATFMNSILRAALGLSSLLFLSLAACDAEVVKKLPAEVRDALNQPSSFELVSLDPAKGLKETEEFHGWKELGKTPIEEADRAKLVDALLKSVEENDGTVAGCFLPRHGLRITKGNKKIDIVICFQCYSANYYVDGKKGGYFLVTRSPQAAFNQALQDRKVALPKQADE